MSEQQTNPYYAVVERFKIPDERNEAGALMSAVPESMAKGNRGKALPPEKLGALIWGLSHENAAVRRCCLELLDQHPDQSAVPHIVKCLDDPIPRVRWHAVHALHCDICKAGQTFIANDIVSRLQNVAENDESKKVREYAAWALGEMEEDSQ